MNDSFRWCSDSEHLDRDYHKTWASLPRMFGTEPTAKTYKYLIKQFNILSHTNTLVFFPLSTDPNNIGTTGSSNLTDWRRDDRMRQAATPRVPSDTKWKKTKET